MKFRVYSSWLQACGSPEGTMLKNYVLKKSFPIESTMSTPMLTNEEVGMTASVAANRRGEQRIQLHVSWPSTIKMVVWALVLPYV
uniref:Uncharacterized protein n=1 Tax=Oryza nivara TaxID=4536 RepID=A0A0E0J7H4_ORYNI